MKPMNEQEKLRVLLGHWAAHNREHAQEFRRWAQRAGQFGSGDAASELKSAVQEMELLNNSLQTALEMLRAPLGDHHHDHDVMQAGGVFIADPGYKRRIL
jgi:hypothetical protein